MFFAFFTFYPGIQVVTEYTDDPKPKKRTPSKRQKKIKPATTQD